MLTKVCQLCGSTQLNLIVDLGFHPLADTFLTKEQLGRELATYPLRLLLCEKCGYVTLQYVIPAAERYQINDYSYTSSNSPVAIAHFKELADWVIKKIGVNQGDLVVDIGSNVGTLLQNFKEATNCQVVGVEPSANIAKIASTDKIPTINNFFGKDAVKIILEQGKAKVITATNVFNHISDLNIFMDDISSLLSVDGVFVFEVPYLLTLVENYLFDTIYLEHVSYFGVKPLVDFFEKYGFYIADIEETEYMGGSIRVFATKNKSDNITVKELIRREESAGIYEPQTYQKFMKKIEHFKFDLCRQIYEIKSKGERIIGIGAATKGNTLLNYCRIDSSILDFITDSSQTKKGKFTPGSNIPIKFDEDITPDIKYGLILPWNIADFLQKKLKHLNLEFIVPKIRK